MYVCVCKAVSDKQVRRSIDEGACSVRALKDRFGLGSVCGRCVPEARAMIEQTHRNQRPVPLSALPQIAAA